MRLEEADLKQMWDMLAAAREGVEFTAGLTEERPPLKRWPESGKAR